MVRYENLGIKLKPVQDEYGKFNRCNPGVILKNGIVHMLYGAIDSESIDKEHNISTIGHAKLGAGGEILYDSNKKVIIPTLPEEVMGCLQPRIVEFEGVFYVFYTAFDGKIKSVAVTKTRDFENFQKLGVIKHFSWDKDAIILSERIDGKVVYIHRAGHEIQLDYFNSINDLVSEESWFGYENRVKAHTIMKMEYDLEKIKVKGSLPLIKTKAGWLLLYHGTLRNSEYRSSVILLDFKNPSKVIAQMPYSMLELTEEGDIYNMIFPAGSYIYNDELYVYYGIEDKYIALAKINVNDLLNELNKYRVEDKIE